VLSSGVRFVGDEAKHPYHASNEELRFVAIRMLVLFIPHPLLGCDARSLML
jgi:hypothetical protein